MPYITQDKRDVLDGPIDEVLNALRELECDDAANNTEGNINYVVTRILQRVYRGGGYAGINDALGVMMGATMEFYRTVAAPYEDQKKHDNGDVE